MSLNHLGIVVLNYNAFDLTKQCIDSILMHYRDRIRIVIVDNQSDDQSFTRLEESYVDRSNVHVILTEYNGGYS